MITFNNIFSYFNNIFQKFKAISFGGKIAFFFLFFLIVGVVIRYLIIDSIVETYVFICMHQFIFALESAVDIIVNDKSGSTPKIIKEVSCFDYEEVFNKKIKPASGELITGKDLLTNKSVCKICLDETLSDQVSFNVPDGYKKYVKKQLMSNCYCTEITDDLKNVLELAVKSSEKNKNKFYFCYIIYL